MKKPTIKEIAEYCGDTQEATLFYQYYDSQGWKVGKNSMKNWKSAISGWMNRNKKRQKERTSKVDKILANERKDIINLFWKRMTENYGHKWASSYGDTPTKPWIAVITQLSDHQIKTGLDIIFSNGDKYDWPPAANEFYFLCRTKPEKQIAIKCTTTYEDKLKHREKVRPIREKEVKQMYSIILSKLGDL